MKLYRKFAWVILGSLLVLGGGGCGGFSASRSVSPMDFILPGLMQAPEPQAPETTPLDAPATQLAQNNR